jgi:di/tricarboxylate transporter
MADYYFLGAVLIALLYLLWSQRIRSDVTAVLVMLSLIAPWPHPDGEWRGVLSYQEGFSGFGSSAVIIIAAMFVLGAAIVRTGAAEVFGLRWLRAVAGREWTLQLAVLTLATTTSMFINDTTVVLILLPLVLTVCKEFDLPPSRYLLFAAYGSLLGGQWTLIGTRSNIIVSDFLRQETGRGLAFFDFSTLGAPVFFASALFLMLVGRHWLPRRRESSSGIAIPVTEYLTEIVLPEGSEYIGSRVADIDVFKTADLAAIAVLRNGERYPSGITLRVGDVIVVRATTDEIRAAYSSPNLQFREQDSLDMGFLDRADLVMTELMVPARSGFAGLTPRSLGLDRKYGLTVLGVSHFGHPIKRGFMTARLRVGDSLLVLGTRQDVQQTEDSIPLIPLRSQELPVVGARKAWIVGSLLLGVVILSMTGLLTPAISIPLAAACAVMFGCLDVRNAYEAIDWPTLVTLGAIIPFGLALEQTGAAHDLADLTVALFSDDGALFIIGSLLLIAIFLTQIIENAAVAIVVAPIAYQIAIATSMDPAPIMVALGVCVSAGFSTPVAHESTILVMGPGQYEFRHYLTIGSILAVITWAVSTILTTAIMP